MEWIYLSIKFYFFIFILGIIFFPITKKIFSRFFFDFGYAFSKIIGIIFISYTIYALGTIKIINFTRENVFLLISVFGLINLFIFLKKDNLNSFLKSKKILIFITEEIIFLSSFLFWAFIRGQEPSIHSLEKFMDFGFINSVLRGEYFPSKDMWLSSESINYYYFGHLTGALLIKLTGILPSIGYNLILANIFALAISQSFSLVVNIIFKYSSKLKKISLLIYGLIGAFLINLAGNLHTIYVFTKGYPIGDNNPPIPFWKIFSGFNPESYWYANATRFIPYTIHEFPSYSYVVADLHGHVFGIPFVLLIISMLFILFVEKNSSKDFLNIKIKKIINPIIINKNYYANLVFIGFIIAISYMTNAFDGPIYLMLSFVIIFLISGINLKFLFSILIVVISFLLFSLPFSYYFSPFVSGIGLNCSPDFLTKIEKIGPFLFEKNKCQISPFWMLFVLWGFFWVSLLFLIITIKNKKFSNIEAKIINFIIILFYFGIFLTIIPEFFYLKDIYPAHFRANTMFKLGYQAYIMMSIGLTFTLFIIKTYKKNLLIIIYSILLFIVSIYPFLAIPSYYGKLNQKPQLDGSLYLKVKYPEDKEIIDWLNQNVNGQPVILEAQGDSYTDFNRISAHTGLPTVAGWWVHQWLWRGSPDYVGKRIPDIVNIYESNFEEEYEEYYIIKPNDYLIKIAEKIKSDNWRKLYELNKDKIKDPNLIYPNEQIIISKGKKINYNKLENLKKLINKYQIKYIVVSSLERQKYPNLNEEKFKLLGEKIFQSSNNLGAIYQLK